MRRIPILLAAIVSAVALPSAAEAAVIPSVSGSTLSVTGDGAADQITVRAPSSSTLQVNEFTFDRGAITKVEIRAGGGDDVVRIADPLTDTVTIESGPGADTVLGGPGAETIAAGDADDTVHPGAGDDTVLLGNGDDTALQGDGVDVLDGQAGKDKLRAVGTAESEEFTVQANGATVRIARDTGPATTDGTSIESLDVTAAGGQDLVDVGDLSPTPVLDLTADLGFLDGARDTIALQGSDGFDNVGLRPFNDDVRVEGLTSRVTIENAVASDDRLTVFGRSGVDFIDADPGTGAKLPLTLDGGPGTDIIDGSDAADTLRGGADTDVITGGKGNDIVDLGDGDDRFSRTVADGIDRIEGGNGFDQLSASGTESDDSISIQGLLARTRLLYGFTGSADMGSVEHITTNPFGGTDNVTVRDLKGTATTKVELFMDTADLRSDDITVHGTHGDDVIKAVSSGTRHAVTGLPATVEVINPERGQKLAIDAGIGKDTVDATGLQLDALQPTLKGGSDRDTLIGSSGSDVIAGGPDVDVALLGGGLDTFTWATGDGNDIVEGGGGTDFLQMSGSGNNERFDVVPVGSRTRVTRDIENVNLDLGGLERIDILPGPGGDIMRVADLSGTATDHVDFNLSVARGQTGGDNTIDRVFVDGSFGNDTINVNGSGPDVRTVGLAAITTVRGTDPELDRLHVDTKPGTRRPHGHRDDEPVDRLHVLLILAAPRDELGRAAPLLFITSLSPAECLRRWVEAKGVVDMSATVIADRVAMTLQASTTETTQGSGPDVAGRCGPMLSRGRDGSSAGGARSGSRR